MIGYYFRFALRALLRSPALTALMIAAIGVGIGASMTALTVFRAASADPMPRKSSQLFVPQIDNCGCRSLPAATPDGMPAYLTYMDALALMRLSGPVRRAAMYATTLSLLPSDPRVYPFQVIVRATFADFFPMFDAPFKFGGPWNAREDDAHAAVAVITRDVNDRVFGGTNSVGRTLRLDNQDYRIIGVLDRWQLPARFYDLSGSPGATDDVFVPFTHAVDAFRQGGGTGPTFMTCNRPSTAPAPARGRSAGGTQMVSITAVLASECSWVQFWLELPTAAAIHRYRDALAAYAAQQRHTGRFRWPPRVQLHDLSQWLSVIGLVPTQVRVAMIIAFSLLLACLVNAMGLILAKFLARAADISVRRAAGATRLAIFAQSLVEIGIIGVLGAVLGALLTVFGLHESRTLLPANLVGMTYLDGTDMVIMLVLAIAATLAAGLYPIWRLTQVQPALQLKTS